MNPADFRLLITGHSAEVDQNDVCEFLKETRFFVRAHADSGLLLDAGRSQLVDRYQRMLDAGFFVRVSSPSAANRATE
jgi:23S rRNA (cytosine1962-C5)-methyltransferase